MKSQRRFAPTGGQFTPESVARFTGIRNFRIYKFNIRVNIFINWSSPKILRVKKF